MLSVLSVPMMVAGSQPTMLTVDMAFRINSYGDYRDRQRARRDLLSDHAPAPAILYLARHVDSEQVAA